MKTLAVIFACLMLTGTAYGAEHRGFMKLTLPVFEYQGMAMVCPTDGDPRITCIDIASQASYSCRVLTPEEGFFDDCRALTGV
jgi:hypothetical protein